MRLIVKPSRTRLRIGRWHTIRVLVRLRAHALPHGVLPSTYASDIQVFLLGDHTDSGACLDELPYGGECRLWFEHTARGDTASSRQRVAVIATTWRDPDGKVHEAAEPLLLDFVESLAEGHG
jgi:hypothetical protein